MFRLRTVVAALAAVSGLALLLPAQDSRPIWIAVGPKAAEADLAPLVEHRLADGFETRFLALEEVPPGKPLGPWIKESLAALVPKPSFVLLVGDGAGSGADWVIPPFHDRKSGSSLSAEPDEAGNLVMTLAPLATDIPFGDFDGDDLPDAAVGRFPVRNPQELLAAVAKTLLYERDLPGGRWQRQSAFVTGEGHYGLVIDAALEKMFEAVVNETFPPDADIDVTYANPSSAYFRPPAGFADFVRDRLGKGSLFFTYVGHGSRTAVDRLRTKEGVFDVLGVKTIATLERTAAPPILTILACHTGAIAHPEDCILERLFRSPGGPVAALGATIPSTPYGNAILGFELARVYHDRSLPRLGQAVDTARRRLVQPSGSALRSQMDKLARLFQGGNLDTKEDARQHVLMYVLLGDPALRIRRPIIGLELKAPSSARPGSTIEVEILPLPGQRSAVLSLECPPAKMKAPLPRRPTPGTPDYDERVLQRHHLANDKRVLDTPVDADASGRLVASLTIPASLSPGRYLLKACTLDPADAMPKELVTGFRWLTIEE